MNELSKISRTLCRSTCWLATGVLLALPVQAESVSISTAHRAAPATVEDLSSLGLEVTDNKVELTLQDAITIALERNLSIDVERFRRGQSALGITEAKGIYDLDLTSTFSIASDTSPPTSALEQTGGQQLSGRSTVWNSELTQPTPFGGSAVLTLDNSRNSTSNNTALFNPEFRLDFDLVINQPLLRNFGRKVTEQTLTISRNNSAISRESFQTQVETVVSQVVQTYWSLVEAKKQLEVAKESLKLANDLDSMNRIQVEVGTLAPLELVQSEAGVATREEAIIRQQAAVEDNADTIRQLLNLDRGELWNVTILPVTEPESEHQPIDMEQAVNDALELRPDIRTQRLTNSNLEVQAYVARNQKKPRLDLRGAWGYNAVAGDLTERNDEGEITFQSFTNYGDALSDIIDGRARGWSVSMTFAYPLQNRVAKARSASADLAQDEGDFALRSLEQQVLTEVRRAARGVETAAKEIESVKVSSRLARKNLEAQRKRYENGLATSFEVLQIQEDLSEAASREVSAIIRYRLAVNTFQQTVGKLLSENGIEIDDPEME